MRTIYVSDNTAEREALLIRLAATLPVGLRSTAGDVADWALSGPSKYVADKIDEYRETLNITHLVVSRLRIEGINKARLRASVTAIAELM